MKEIITYIIHPNYLKKREERLSSLAVFKTLFWSFCLLLAINFATKLLLLLLGQERVQFNTSANGPIIQQPWAYAHFALFILAPVYEELAFRLQLIFSKKRMALSTALILAYCVAPMLHSYVAGMNGYLILSVVALLAFFPLYFLLRQIDFEQLWKQYFRWVYYLYAVFFALFHLRVVDMDLANGLPIIIYLTTVFGYGLVLSYVRLTLGLIYAMGLHGVINLLSY